MEVEDIRREAVLMQTQGYETVAGVGKSGYNAASNLGSAITGGGGKTDKVDSESELGGNAEQK